MTESERTIAAAIGQCTFCPGIGTKRFARQMANTAQHSPNYPLSAKQRTYLLQVAVKFRRQLAPAVVDLARAQMAADELKPEGVQV